MDKETDLIIYEEIPAEHREALVTSVQEAARAFREASENIGVALADMLEAVAQIFSDSLQPIIDKLIDELDSLYVATERRKKWKPVKNTVPRYHCDQRKITPRARSCC